MREHSMIADDERREVDTGDMAPADIQRLYEILAIAKPRDRFVIPTRRGEIGRDPYGTQGASGFPIQFDPPATSLDGACGASNPGGSPLPFVPVSAVRKEGAA